MRVVTIKDVAKAAGVSISTVSRVLNDRRDVDAGTRARVWAMIRQLNYVRNQSASNLKQQSTSAIGVILLGRRNSFLTDLAEEIMEAGRGSGFVFVMDILDEKANPILAARRLFLERRLQDVIFLGANLEGMDGQLATLELPQVYATVQAGHLPYAHIASVSIDNYRAGRMAARRLMDLGHRDIALMGYFAKADDSTGQRLHGAVDEMREAGHPHDPALFAEVNFTLSSAYAGAISLLDSGKPFTALFACSDIIAIGAIKALHDRGLSVPGDVSVIGFDGLESGRYTIPELATIRQPSLEIARTAVRLLRGMIEGAPAEHVLLDCELVEGQSLRAL